MQLIIYSSDEDEYVIAHGSIIKLTKQLLRVDGQVCRDLFGSVSTII
jgi:hypothetical protein